MKLNTAEVVNTTVNGVDLSFEKFIDYLQHSNDVVADVYLNDRLAFSGVIKFIVLNGYLIACVDERFAFDTDVIVKSITVRAHQAASETELLATWTHVNTIIDSGDIDSDLYFKITNVVPDCAAKDSVPDSRFNNLFTDKRTKINLMSQPKYILGKIVYPLIGNDTESGISCTSTCDVGTGVTIVIEKDNLTIIVSKKVGDTVVSTGDKVYNSEPDNITSEDLNSIVGSDSQPIAQFTTENIAWGDFTSVTISMAVDTAE